MKVLNAREAEVVKNPHGVKASKVYARDSAVVMHIELKAGEALKRHITPVDVIFYVLEGYGTVEVGEKSRQVGVDSVIDSPAGVAHRWFNDSDGLLRVLVIKAPRPKEATKILE